MPVQRKRIQSVECANGKVISCISYKVTGKIAYTDRNFPAIHTDNFFHAQGINLWRGTVWGLDAYTGKWRKLWEVYN